MANAELIFESCRLDIVVPDVVISLPDKDDADVDSWLERLSTHGDRQKAFFGQFKLRIIFSC